MIGGITGPGRAVPAMLVLDQFDVLRLQAWPPITVPTPPLSLARSRVPLPNTEVSALAAPQWRAAVMPTARRSE
jgi:hypothetical protein